jgi:hypothetical protein
MELPASERKCQNVYDFELRSTGASKLYAAVHSRMCRSHGVYVDENAVEAVHRSILLADTI